MKNSSSYADKITKQDMWKAVDILNSIGVGTFTFHHGNYEYVHRIKDDQDVTILIGNTKRELYGKMQAFVEGVRQERFHK